MYSERYVYLMNLLIYLYTERCMFYPGCLIFIKIIETSPLNSCIAIKDKIIEKVNLLTLVTKFKKSFSKGFLQVINDMKFIE